ncbi:uncharacterized protein PHALS_00696 [Plasmopara halstedii]|uniref:Uncharacterized protein n=1 Tax=Plasmopara halstedii TaxID=4781 RepID=A0A0P1ATY0_PLAHL|nr:uncharacterized protein PHALS_00696 [Plasmopara halstedii]CEG44327.1 hypothetical protein PHALS_00696 [Plasmopara halstedii]|eukprot:XP_024580696.1 hypothetical protein PHALS_00696 [Plasmopara halstedii]
MIKSNLCWPVWLFQRSLHGSRPTILEFKARMFLYRVLSCSTLGVGGISR